MYKHIKKQQEVICEQIRTHNCIKYKNSCGCTELNYTTHFSYYVEIVFVYIFTEDARMVVK